MDSIRLINYRTFEDTGDVAIKPLTFLLGANSSGKSSFLKILPLLKQSISSNVRGSLLWNGDLVDYNDFKTVVHNGEGDITISFHIPNLQLRLFSTKRGTACPCTVTLVLSGFGGQWDYLKSVEMHYNSLAIKIECEYVKEELVVSAIYVDGDKLSTRYNKILLVTEKALLPKLVFCDNSRYYYEYPRKVLDGLLDSVKVRGGEKLDFIDLRYSIYNTIINDILEGKKTHRINNKDIDIDDFDSFKKDCVYCCVNEFLDAVNFYLSQFSNQITYVAPLRANFERYYRFQNYSVESIESDGRNLAMFFNSLSKEKMDEFNEWLSRVFKFSVDITPSEGHVQIEIQEYGKEKRNLVDLGFGYTELLPILAMIWKTVNSGLDKHIITRSSCNQYTFAIEQPELHLHPRFQAMFSRLLALVISDAKESGMDIRFVIETHSEVIVNKIGEFIEQGIVDPKDVNVVLFNASGEGMEKYVECTNFSEDGFLVNWPYGFFDENYVDRDM